MIQRFLAPPATHGIQPFGCWGWHRVQKIPIGWQRLVPIIPDQKNSSWQDDTFQRGECGWAGADTQIIWHDFTTCKNSHSSKFYHILPTILDSFPLDAILDSAFHAIAPLNLLCYLWLVFRNQLRSRVSEVLLRDVHCIRGRSLIQQPLGWHGSFCLWVSHPESTTLQFLDVKLRAWNGICMNLYNPALIQPENMRLHHDWYVMQSRIWDHGDLVCCTCSEGLEGHHRCFPLPKCIVLMLHWWMSSLCILYVNMQLATDANRRVNKTVYSLKISSKHIGPQRIERCLIL